MEHTYVIGKTGMGKSTFLSNFFFDELQNEDARSIVFIDPHGENVRALADALPRSAIKRTCFLDAADYHYPIGFDPLRNPIHCLTGLKSVWRENWGPRLEWLLLNALLLVAANNGGTFREVTRVFTDVPLRERLLENISSTQTDRLKYADVLAFWTKEFPAKYEKARDNPDSPILNKIGQLNQRLPHILCQRTPKLDFGELLQKRGILLVNLAAPTLGDEASGLLGAMITTALRGALLETPTPCTLIADEFQTYGTSLYSSMLAEMRKFGLQILLCHQFISQVDEQLRDAILGNTAHQVIFNVGYNDAVVLAKTYNRLTQDFNPAAITELQPFDAFVNGAKQTLPDFTPPFGTGRYADVQTYARLHYGQRSASRLNV